MEIAKKDLKVVKMMLARCALLPNFKGGEWLRGYAEILLHKMLEATARAAGKRCPALGSTTKIFWANSATTDPMHAHQDLCHRAGDVRPKLVTCKGGECRAQRNPPHRTTHTKCAG